MGWREFVWHGLASGAGAFLGVAIGAAICLSVALIWEYRYDHEMTRRTKRDQLDN